MPTGKTYKKNKPKSKSRATKKSVAKKLTKADIKKALRP
jgi:hypothetical protein